METDSTDLRTLLVVIANTARFATEHPFAATGILGAAAGSWATYSVMNKRMQAQDAAAVRGKTYEIQITDEELENLQDNPEHCWLRYEFPLVTVVIKKDIPERPLMLPDVIIDQPPS